MLTKTILVTLKSHLNCCSLEWECLRKENALVGTKSPWVLFKESSPAPISQNRFAPFCFDWQQTHHFLVVEKKLSRHLVSWFVFTAGVFGFSCSEQFKASILSKCNPVLRKLLDGTGSQIQNLVKRMQKDVQNLMKLLPHRLRKKRSKKRPQNVAKNIDPKTDPKTDPKIFKGKSFLFFFGSVFGSVFGSHFSQNWIGFWTRFWTRFGISFSTTFGYERQKKLDTFLSGCSSDVKVLTHLRYSSGIAWLLLKYCRNVG